MGTGYQQSVVNSAWGWHCIAEEEGIASPPGQGASSPPEGILLASGSRHALRGGLGGARSLCVRVWSARAPLGSA